MGYDYIAYVPDCHIIVDIISGGMFSKLHGEYQLTGGIENSDSNFAFFGELKRNPRLRVKRIRIILQ
jgi:hypothetical protein